jgi:hypothetical protein
LCKRRKMESLHWHFMKGNVTILLGATHLLDPKHSLLLMRYLAKLTTSMLIHITVISLICRSHMSRFRILPNPGSSWFTQAGQGCCWRSAMWTWRSRKPIVHVVEDMVEGSHLTSMEGNRVARMHWPMSHVIGVHNGIPHCFS